MEISEALKRLKEYSSELEHLRTLRHGNQERWRWKDKVNVVLVATFGKESDEYEKLNPKISIGAVGGDDAEEQLDYLQDLDSYEAGIRYIFDKYEILGIPEASVTIKEPAMTESPKAFIAHGGDSPALGKLKNFLVALGVQPLVVEEQASEGRSVGEKVDWYSQQADCAIILAAKGDIDGKTGGFIPRGNVLMEIGKLQHLYKGKIIYLLQSNTRFPSNISEKVWARFSPQSMDNSFTTVARELTAFGILKAVKP
ncbi:hypothetical protein ES708_34222 [subsurface metagenome]